MKLSYWITDLLGPVPRPQPLMKVWWLMSASSHPKMLFKSVILLVNIVYTFMCTYAHCPNNTLTQPTSEDCYIVRIFIQRELLYSEDCYTARVVIQRGLLYSENCYTVRIVIQRELLYSENCYTARIVIQRGLLHSEDCYTARIVTQRGLLYSKDCYGRIVMWKLSLPPSLPTLLLSPLPLYKCNYPNPFMYGWHDYKCNLTQVIY